ncbi:MAG: hypothetical protein AAB489_05525, partial [Patescibacteria group bacterium]
MQGKIPVVTGVPGRGGNPLGNIRSGMARRDETLTYPDMGTTRGLGTACRPYVGTPGDLASSRITVMQWSGNGPAEDKIPIEVQHPYYEDPPCLWRTGWQQTDPPHNETKCKEFCEWVNGINPEYPKNVEYTFWDCKKAVEIIDPITGESYGWECIEDGDKYICTEDWIDIPYSKGFPWHPWDSDLAAIIPTLKQYCDPNTSMPNIGDLPNARKCIGESCRTPPSDPPYMSFYRKYVGSYERDPVVTDKDTDLSGRAGAVACYGLYNEFDPKTKLTNYRDQRCVISIDVSGYPDSQKGKGMYQGQMPFPADPSGPLKRNPLFNRDKDLWYQNLGGGISFLNTKIFEEIFRKDLSNALLTVDEARQSATQPFYTTNKKEAATSLIRAYDDTVSNERGDKRTVAEWWQRFENDAKRVFSRPVVRLFLPPAWSFGVDPLDPLFTGETEREDPGDPTTALRRDSRMKAIDIQLHAEEDLLGRIAAFLERQATVKIQEEAVPLVYPLGSPVEFRAWKQAWITWKTKRKGPAGATFTGEADVDTLIAKLEEYAVLAENVRLLRAELPRFVGRLVAGQRNAVEKIGDWMKENLTEYRNYISFVRSIDGLREEWKRIQKSYANFHDKTNMPWCKNDRFTVPIYSLLDPWMPRRDGSQDRDLDSDEIQDCAAEDGFPRLCPDEELRDLVFDFSNMRLKSSATPVKIPVLKPTLVRLRVPMPPGLDATGADAEINPPDLWLPNFPDPPTIADMIGDSPEPPIIELNAPPVMDASTLIPDQQLINQWWVALGYARWIVDGMNGAYGVFWDSIRMFDEAWADRENRDAPPLCATSQGLVELKPLECCGWTLEHCVHVEMDLAERFMRIGARPAVLLQEDFASKGEKRVYPDCDPKDHVCAALYPEERSAKNGWQILLPEQEGLGAADLENLRTRVREKTLTPSA